MDSAGATLRDAGEEAQDHAEANALRELMRQAGVRYTLSRLKILEALYAACLDSGSRQPGVAPQSLYEALHEVGEPLSSASVRQVLRRMSAKGLVEPCGRGRYRLFAQHMSQMVASSTP